MPRNGSGGYSPPQNSWNPAINGMAALPNDWMAILNDMAAAIQASIAADGQTPITGSLNFGNNRLRNVGAPQGQGDGLRLEQIMKGADIPSATTIAFPIEGSLFEVTGTTTITGIAGSFIGRMVVARFMDTLTLTNGTNLILPGGANITTQAGDFAAFVCLDGTKWQCWLYPRAQSDASMRVASSDHFGATAPTETWPGMTWADSGTNTLWRRNAADDGWVNEGVLFQRALPGMTFAQIDALTEDQGPITCTDQDGILYAWDGGQSKYVAQVADDETALAKSSRVNLLTPAGLGFSLQPEVTDEATFTKLTNNIELTDIRDELALEVGDVIQISGSADNDNLYTVESITDADNIIVNYEHRNGAGSLSLVDETTNVTIKRIAKWFNAPTGLGRGAVDVTGSRAVNTTYTNGTGRDMYISTRIGISRYLRTRATPTSPWITAAFSGGNESGPGSFIIPRGWQYLSTGDNNYWTELR